MRMNIDRIGGLASHGMGEICDLARDFLDVNEQLHLSNVDAANELARANDAEAREKKLKEALRAYGVHGAACQRRQHWAGDPAYCPCSCGFDRVLRGEERQ